MVRNRFKAIYFDIHMLSYYEITIHGSLLEN